MKTTTRRRQPRPVVRQVTPLAADDDLVRDLLLDQLAAIEPLDVSDLLDLADLAVVAEAGRIELQTVVIDHG